MKVELTKLPFNYDALEPFIDAKTMEIHHGKHHQTYVNNLNNALAKHPDLNEEIKNLLKNPHLIPDDIKTAVLNNGGGHYNHDFFWHILSKNQELPTGPLMTAITDAFGDFASFKESFKNSALSRFGSGWAWLVVAKDKSLKIVSTANQDVPFAEGDPILNIDVWEHAYYLNYQNRRGDYIDAFFNVINWEYVEKLYCDLVK